MFNLTKISDKAIELSFYLLFLLIPLILTPYNYELFEYNKMMLTYGLTIIIGCFWLIKIISFKKYQFSRSPFDIFILFFLLSQVLSTIFSWDIHESLWGYYSRFHGGLISTISYTVLYFAFINNLSNLSHLKYLSNLIKLTLATGFIVSLYGIAEHFGIDKNLWVQDVQNRIFSTLGQPNWLGAYVAILIPITMGVGLNSKFEALNSKRIQNTKNIKSNWILPLTSYLLPLTFYLTLLFTKSRSGMIGFWVANFAFWVVIFLRFRFKSFLRACLILNTCFLILTFLIGGSSLGPLEKFSYPKLFPPKTLTSPKSPTPMTPSNTSIIETGVTESGTIRKIVWQGALDIFLHNPIFGTGVETFAQAYYQYRPVKHNVTSEWDFLYNKAHNEFLNFLATTGIVGFGAWIGFILSFIWWFYKTYKSYKTYNILAVGLFSAWLSILVTDFFGFSVVVVALFFFLIPAFCFILQREASSSPNLPNLPNSTSHGKQIALILTICALSLYLLFSLVKMWRADTYFAKGYRENHSGQYVIAYENLTTAVKLNPNEPNFLDELAFSSAILAVALVREKNATSSSLLLKQAIVLSDKVILENPHNINYYKSRVRLFYVLSEINPKYKDEVLAALEKSVLLSPSDPKIRYNLAVVLAQSGRTDKALSAFLKAIDLKPDYRDAHYGLALFYKDQKRLDEAKKELNFILERLIPNDLEAKKKLEEWEKE